MSSFAILHFALIIIYVLQVNFHFFEQFGICVLVDYIELAWSKCLVGQRCRFAAERLIAVIEGSNHADSLDVHL